MFGAPKDPDSPCRPQGRDDICGSCGATAGPSAAICLGTASPGSRAGEAGCRGRLPGPEICRSSLAGGQTFHAPRHEAETWRVGVGIESHQCLVVSVAFFTLFHAVFFGMDGSTTSQIPGVGLTCCDEARDSAESAWLPRAAVCGPCAAARQRASSSSASWCKALAAQHYAFARPEKR